MTSHILVDLWHKCANLVPVSEKPVVSLSVVLAGRTCPVRRGLVAKQRGITEKTNCLLSGNTC